MIEITTIQSNDARYPNQEVFDRHASTFNQMVINIFSFIDGLIIDKNEKEYLIYCLETVIENYRNYNFTEANNSNCVFNDEFEKFINKSPAILENDPQKQGYIGLANQLTELLNLINNSLLHQSFSQGLTINETAQKADN